MRRSTVMIAALLLFLLSVPVSATLTHRYSFADNPNPSDPNVLDLVGSQHGTPMNGAGVDTTIVTGGQAVLDRSGQYINLPGAGINLPSYAAITIEQWITSATTNTLFTMSFAAGITGNPGMQYLCMQPTRENPPAGDGCRFTITHSDYSTEAWSQSSQLNDGLQHHLVGTVDGDNIQLYVDGIAMPVMALTDQSIALLSNASLYFGRSVYTSSADVYFAGSINETRIYNNVLSGPAVVLNNQLGPDTYQPCALTSLTPAYKAVNIPLATTLSWASDVGITVTRYEVFVETDPNLLDPNDVAVPSNPDYSGANTSLDISGLEYDTPYYWRVDIVAADDTRYMGPRFEFRTLPPSPSFTVNPGTSVADPDGSVSLTATANSAFALTENIRWYKEAGVPDVKTDDVEITTADPDLTISQTVNGSLTTSTLTINNVGVARNGAYYAHAVNSTGGSNSANGWIVVRGMIAHYEFENNLNDSSGNGLHGAARTPSGAAATIAYVASVTPAMGQAMSMTGTGTSNPSNTTDPYVDLPNDFGNFSQGLTIAAWVNPSAAATWARICQFGNGNNAANNSFYFTRNGSTTQIRFENDNTNPNSATLITGANNTITTGAWQHFAVTINTNATNNAAIYRNGVRVAYGTVNLPNPVIRTNCFIGRSEWNGDSLFRGQMDDFRVYNYALTRQDIAQMYMNGSGNTTPICQYAPSYDYNADCMFNLEDFVVFAAQWLSCGWYPQSQCD
ncbi:MAG: hypothetical protein LLF76_15635 [Planctomycetaceae bacterium]|nr:hypothetical protein [Planctomycetaceae bacterium]